jgi:hypothetical protein
MTSLAQEAFAEGVELRDGRGAHDWVYEAACLNNIVGPADQQRLRPGRVPVPAEERDRAGRWRLVLGELDAPELITVRQALALQERSPARIPLP